MKACDCLNWPANYKHNAKAKLTRDIGHQLTFDSCYLDIKLKPSHVYFSKDTGTGIHL